MTMEATKTRPNILTRTAGIAVLGVGLLATSPFVAPLRSDAAAQTAPLTRVETAPLGPVGSVTAKPAAEAQKTGQACKEEPVNIFTGDLGTYAGAISAFKVTGNLKTLEVGQTKISGGRRDGQTIWTKNTSTFNKIDGKYQRQGMEWSSNIGSGLGDLELNAYVFPIAVTLSGVANEIMAVGTLEKMEGGQTTKSTYVKLRTDPGTSTLKAGDVMLTRMLVERPNTPRNGEECEFSLWEVSNLKELLNQAATHRPGDISKRMLEAVVQAVGG